MRHCLVLLLAGALTGCTSGIAERQVELTQWVGRPEIELVAAMGAPNRTYQTGGMKFLTYEDKRVEVVSGMPYFEGYGPFGYEGEFPPTTTTLVCDTTFSVSGNVVRGFSLRGNDCG